MAHRVHFEWEGKEYDHVERSADWYWALGIIAAATSIASILFGNILLAVLIIVAAASIALHAMKHPPMHRFKLTDHGLAIGSEMHHYDRMLSFSVLEHIDGEFPPMLSIKTESWFSPRLIVPLENVDADRVYAFLLDRVDEGEHKHTVADLLSSWMGF